MWVRKKTYYIAYDVFTPNDKVIHGSATFVCKGKPNLEKWIEDIERYNLTNGANPESIQILSCIEVDKDFII